MVPVSVAMIPHLMGCLYVSGHAGQWDMIPVPVLVLADSSESSSAMLKFVACHDFSAPTLSHPPNGSKKKLEQAPFI